MTTTTTAPSTPVTIALPPELVGDLEVRADAARPGEPAITGGEALALIRALRDAHAHTVSYALQAARVRTLATEWAASPDIQLAAAGRILQRTLDGSQPPTGLI